MAKIFTNGSKCLFLTLLFNLTVSVLFSIFTMAFGSELQQSPNKQGPTEKVVMQHLSQEYHTECSKLLPGQFLCLDLNIDPKTQQPRDCHPQLQRANVTCEAAPGIICHETRNSTFTGTIPCKYTNGYDFETAMLLSIFFGMLGLDRFYLGYHAIGLAKLCTLGFLFIGQMVDIVLIATQSLGPADGSHYVISYYGAGINVISVNNETYRMPQEDWIPSS